MFRRKKDSGEDSDAAQRPDSDDLAPPLKPFSKRGTHAPSKPPTKTTLPSPDVPRRILDIPGVPRRPEQRGGANTRPSDSDNKRLIVGRDIRLSGEITSCDRLVVEGRVEVALSDARIIEIAPSGHFKGGAEVDEADISGRFEGELVARERLVIRAGGRVSGSIRYGRIVIENGGEISGDMRTLDTAESSSSSSAESSPAPSMSDAPKPDPDKI